MNKKRIISYMLGCIGIIGLLIYAAWLNFIQHQLLKLPADFKYSAQLISQDNFFDPIENKYVGAVESLTDFAITTQSFEPNTLLLTSNFHVTKKNGETIIDLNRKYSINRETHEHIKHPWADHSRDGFLFAPPANNKQAYTYWHINYDQPLTLEYREDEEIDRLKLQIFETSFTTDQTAVLTNLPDVGIHKGINLDVNLKIWIEPQTGRMMKYEDRATAYFYDLQTKERLYPWNQFSNQFTHESFKAQLDNTKSELTRINLITKIIPRIILSTSFVALIFTIIFFQKIFRLIYVLPAAVCIISSIATYNAYLSAQMNVDRQFEDIFRHEYLETISHISEDLQIYANILESARGFLNASETVSRDEWKIYVNSLNLEKNYPGIQGIGYAEFVPPENVQEHIAAIQKEGFPEYTIKPPGTREIYSSIVYIEPFNARNKQAFGFDMYQNDIRRKAMDIARDQNDFAMSGVVKLEQEIDADIQSGFLIYLPIYKKNTDINTPEDRQKNILGFVYSPFRARNFIDSIYNKLGYNVKMKIYNQEDSSVLDDSHLIFSNTESSQEAINITHNIFGQTWIYKIYPNDKEIPIIQKNIPIAIGLFGGLLTIVITMLIYNIISFNQKASNKVKEKTAELQKERNKLIAAKARDDAILKGVGENLFATDLDGRIILVNDLFCKTLGWEREFVIGKLVTEIITVFDAQGNQLPNAHRPLMEILTNKNSHKSVISNDHYYQKKNMQRIPVAITIAPIIRKKQTTGAVIVFRDITEEKQLDKTKSEFVSLASHQLRTPISAINWYTEMLLDGDSGSLTKQQQAFIQEIADSNTRMTQLVNSLLNVSRVEMGAFLIEPQNIQILDIAKVVLKEVVTVYKKKKINSNTHIPKTIPQMQADPQLLHIIILNLLTNAFKYTSSGKTIDFTIKADNSNKNIFITVEDQGIGIPQSQQHKIFTKLFRADNALNSDTDGTGLGLYLIKSILEIIDGDIAFQSTEGKGSSFTVVLPRVWQVSSQQGKQLDA